jgi:hypothetical protein
LTYVLDLRAAREGKKNMKWEIKRIKKWIKMLKIEQEKVIPRIILAWLISTFIIMPIKHVSPILFYTICAILLWVAIYKLYILNEK